MSYFEFDPNHYIYFITCHPSGRAGGGGVVTCFQNVEVSLPVYKINILPSKAGRRLFFLVTLLNVQLLFQVYVIYGDPISCLHYLLFP